MKKLLYFSFIIISLCLASCSQQKKESYFKEPLFTTDDTIKVLSMTEGWLEKVKNKEIREACDFLYNLENEGLDKYSESQIQALEQQFATFPVLSYKLLNMTWNNPYDVTLQYSYEFFEKNPEDNIPNTMNIVFRPQKRNKMWYLNVEKKSVIQ